MATAPSPASNYFLSSFGGAARREPPGGSAFAHRDALFYCEPGAGWNGSQLTSTALGWVADFAHALRPYVDGGYVNVPNAGAADWEKQYYGGHAARLRQVKTAYDPDNVFRFEQSVPPAASTGEGEGAGQNGKNEGPKAATSIALRSNRQQRDPRLT
jgi:berberine-like enzyme